MKRLRFALISSAALLLLVSFSLDIEAGRRSRDRQRDRTVRDRSARDTRDTRKRETRTRQRPIRYDRLRSGDVVEIPMPDGETSRYQLSSAPLLSEALARAYPHIKTFRAQDTDEPGAKGRFVVLGNRLHGLVLAPEGPMTVDAGGNRTESAVLGSAAKTGDAPGCGTADLTRLPAAGLQLEDFSAGSEIRSYRLVIASAAEYTLNAGGTDAAMLEIAALVNDITAIYERDAATTFILEDTLIFDDPDTDPYPEVGNDTTGLDFEELLEANQTTVDTTVLPENYDLSVVLTRSNPVATVGITTGSTCDDASKASSGLASDGADVMALAHHVGHLFGATHTYNSTLGLCIARNADSAYEPGSGSTIMGGGDCGAELVPDPGEYFHNNSIEQILGFRDANLVCGDATVTGNTPPSVDAGPDVTVPRDTPFVLIASGSDADDDPLSYTWEQFDLGDASPPLNEANGPLFRSLPPSSDPGRSFPSMASLLSGVDDPFENLPSVDRDLTFRATVRDENGGVADDEMVVTVAGDPFQVLSPNGGELFSAGCVLPVSWEVGGGSISATVNILLLDGLGASELLAEGTDNDGEEIVPVPCMSSIDARIMVEAADGIFFDVSDGGFTIDLEPPVIVAEVSADDVDEACESTIFYSAEVVDDCGVDAGDVVVSVLASANATLGQPSLEAEQISPTEVTALGSVVISDLTSSPAVVEIEFLAEDSCDLRTTEVEVVMVSDVTPPAVTCPENLVVECSVFFGVPIDDPQLVDFFAGFMAEDNCDPDPVLDNDAPMLFPLGDTSVAFTATDASGNVGACTAIVTVVDTTPPDVLATVSPTMIWPPNHKLWDIQARVTAVDICDPDPVTVLFSVESNEPGNGQGDGNTEPDVVGADLLTLDLNFQVRAERSGQGGGRVYSILYTATDLSGNVGEDGAEVMVPHDQRNRNRSRR